MNGCEICGATEDLSEDEDMNYRKVWLCDRGKCMLEWQREMRAADDQEYQDDLHDLNQRYGRGW